MAKETSEDSYFYGTACMAGSASAMTLTVVLWGGYFLVTRYSLTANDCTPAVFLACVSAAGGMFLLFMSCAWWVYAVKIEKEERSKERRS